MISNLTPEQASFFPSIVEKFTKFRLSTQPLNQPQAIKAVNLVYQCGGLDQPQEIIFVKSPMVGSILAQQLTKSKDTIHPINYSDLDLLAFYYTFRQLGLTEETKSMTGLFAIAEECGYIWTFENLCIVSERPTSIMINEQGKLHNLKGPAISWNDGYGQYYINGKFVHPDIGARLAWYLNHRKSNDQPKFSLEKELKKFQDFNLEVGNQIKNQVSEQVSNQVWNQVWAQVWNQVYNQVKNQVWIQVWTQVSNQVSNQVWTQVSNQI